MSELNLPAILFNVTGTFEYELLIELMLRHWNHPLADESEYRNELLEAVAELLARASQGTSFGDMPAHETNLVYAVWFIESESIGHDDHSAILVLRKQWLDAVRRALPSCFCSQDLLE